MLNRSLVSSNSNEWATPQKLFDMLDSEFHFTLDPCSSHMNCKTDKHYTINENGLQQDWSGEHVFMNPPYGYQTSQWIEKAYKESLRGAVVVCLIVARTDTSYWHDIIFKYAAQLTFSCRLLSVGERRKYGKSGIFKYLQSESSSLF